MEETKSSKRQKTVQSATEDDCPTASSTSPQNGQVKTQIVAKQNPDSALPLPSISATGIPPLPPSSMSVLQTISSIYPMQYVDTNRLPFPESKAFWRSQTPGTLTSANDYSPVKQHQPQPCPICKKPIEDDDEGLKVKDTIFHKDCFCCSDCSIPFTEESIYFENQGKYYCTREKASLKISITNQPEKYQVANYNIYPAPQIQIESAFTSNLTVTTQLCVRETALPVPGAFQTGSSRDITVGSKIKNFSGLKLCKKGVIKNYLKEVGLSQRNVSFCIRFTIGNHNWYTSSFKIVSSCSQLPEKVRDTVRPFTTAPSEKGGRGSRKNTSPPPQPTQPTHMQSYPTGYGPPPPMLGPFMSPPLPAPNSGYPMPYPFPYGIQLPPPMPSLHTVMEAEVIRKGDDRKGLINFLVNKDDEEKKD